ncbi:MAG: CPBP family intramembrane glutamic endopeptidase [Armatimonadota bacterium]
METTSPFLEIARQGRNEWWRYVAGIVLVSACWVGGEVLVALPAFVQEADSTGADLLLFVALLLSFAPALIGVWLVVRFLHGRPLITLITPRGRIGWNRLAIGFGVWFAISAGASALEALLHPGRYQPNPEPLTVLPFLLVGTLLIPIQAGAEELFYRGYLLQGMGLLIRQTLLLSALNGLLFALPHAGNPETVASFAKVLLIYLLAGFFWALITLRSGTLELALGAHIANNLFTTVVANYETTAIPSRSFFVVNEIDAIYQLAALVAGMGLFYLFCKTS